MKKKIIHYYSETPSQTICGYLDEAAKAVNIECEGIAERILEDMSLELDFNSNKVLIFDKEFSNFSKGFRFDKILKYTMDLAKDSDSELGMINTWIKELEKSLLKLNDRKSLLEEK